MLVPLRSTLDTNCGLDVGRDGRQMIDIMLQSEVCFGIILLASPRFFFMSQQSKSGPNGHCCGLQ